MDREQPGPASPVNSGIARLSEAAKALREAAMLNRA